jgi:hypothetical protein
MLASKKVLVESIDKVRAEEAPTEDLSSTAKARQYYSDDALCLVISLALLRCASLVCQCYIQSKRAGE